MPSSVFDATDDLPSVSYLPDMAKLLSASSYPNVPAGLSAQARQHDQLYGGLLATPDSADEEEEEDESRPKKRSKSTKANTSKASENQQDAPKKQRGRPKVSTRDETAAERRRTQIRLAQRAYRNRKENTITELTQKVESLQATMKHLNTGFARLREILLNNGMIQTDSLIARQVDDLMRQLTEALEAPPSDAEKSSDDNENEIQGQNLIHDRDQYGMFDGHIASMGLQGQTNPVSMGLAANLQSHTLGVDADHNMLDLDVQNLTDFQTYPALPKTYPTSFASKAMMARSPDPQPSSNEPLALMSIERFPNKNSYTYSFQETTFARRLHRLCIERAYQRLMSPHVDPNWLLRTFRFTLNFTNKERIINAFKIILSRGTDEPLENWRTPFIHVGGAGLHFPRRDHIGQPVYPPNLLHPGRSVSTFSIPNPATSSPGNSWQEVLESVGFGGDWFDCHDVEEYLKTKGIYPDPQSSFVIVNSGLIDLPIPSWTDTVGTASSSSGPQSPNSTQALQTHTYVDLPEDHSNPSQAAAKLAAIPEMDTSIDAWLNQQDVHYLNDFDMELQPSKYEVAARENRTLTIEIERFLERLSDQSVCLGRAPGFRKKYVDDALTLAMQEAF